MHSSTLVVVKVGGSLFDLPHLGAYLKRWLDCLASPALIVPGGGPLVDAVRDLDQRHKLGEETSHWLALRAMSLNTLFLSKVLDGAEVIKDLSGLQAATSKGRLAILDAFPFAVKDEGQPGCLPHHWAVTSDSIAARATAVLGALTLVLLKSVDMPKDANWAEAERIGIVDPYFRKALTPTVSPRLVNFRQWVQEHPEP
jgi:aspartokinase-like uncharacterized kinase